MLKKRLRESRCFQTGVQFSTTPLVKPSGAYFPHIVVLDFAQDKTFGREDMGWSHPTAMPIQHCWSMNQCPVLLFLYLPIPFLISVKGLETACPDLIINPILSNDINQLSAAIVSPIKLVGSVDLHFHFSGPSPERAKLRIGLCLVQ